MSKFLEKLIAQVFSDLVPNIASVDSRVNTVKPDLRLLTYSVTFHALLLSSLFKLVRSLFYWVPSVSLLFQKAFRKIFTTKYKIKEYSPLPSADRVNNPHPISREDEHPIPSAILYQVKKRKKYQEELDYRFLLGL